MRGQIRMEEHVEIDFGPMPELTPKESQILAEKQAAASLPTAQEKMP